MSDQEILVVVSKLKNYIRTKSGMSTSAGVAKELSSRIKILLDEAIECAQKDKRKTVMDRDLPNITLAGSGTTNGSSSISSHGMPSSGGAF